MQLIQGVRPPAQIHRGHLTPAEITTEHDGIRRTLRIGGVAFHFANPRQSVRAFHRDVEVLRAIAKAATELADEINDDANQLAIEQAARDFEE